MAKNLELKSQIKKHLKRIILETMKDQLENHVQDLAQLRDVSIILGTEAVQDQDHQI